MCGGRRKSSLSLICLDRGKEEADDFNMVWREREKEDAFLVSSWQDRYFTCKQHIAVFNSISLEPEWRSVCVRCQEVDNDFTALSLYQLVQKYRCRLEQLKCL